MSKARIIGLALAVIIPSEGLRQVAYYDPPMIPTVCWGHTGPEVKIGQKWTIEQCRAALDKDAAQALAAVERCAPKAPDSVKAGFTSAVFNLGPKIACDQSKSTAARMLAAGDYAGACNQLPRWDRASVAGQMVALPGLTKRRKAEQELCLQGL